MHAGVCQGSVKRPFDQVRFCEHHKKGLFLSPGFKAKYGAVSAMIETHAVGECTGMTPHLNKAWKRGWRTWRSFEAWQQFLKARKTQAMAIFTSDELKAKREKGEDDTACCTLADFFSKVAVVEKATRGLHVARVPRRS